MPAARPAPASRARGERLGLSLQEIKQLVDMYGSGTDERPQLEAFLAVLGDHRRQLEQQLEDIQVTLAEIGQHEARCRTLLGQTAEPARRTAARQRRVSGPFPEQQRPENIDRKIKR